MKAPIFILAALLLVPLAMLRGADRNAAKPDSVILPLTDSAFLLDAEYAQLLQGGPTGVAVKPRLIPLADGDGFAATQVIAPVAPTDGWLWWTLEAPKADRYRVTLEFNQTRHGNGFELRVGEQVLTGVAPDTRGGMALLEVGEINLPAGRQTVLLHNTTSLEKTFMSVGALYLRPASQPAMTRPQIRAALIEHKPRTRPTELLLPGVFSDHMVLQRDMPVPVLGRATPAANITVGFRGQTKQAKADADGRWLVRLDPLQAGGPFEMEIGDGTKTVRFVDVLVGEVWFGSGQSNMEVSVNFLPQQAKPAAPYECDADTKQFIESGVGLPIRLSAVTRDRSKNPGWAALDGANCLNVPALMTSTAILLHQKLKVPVGIIVRCESSSPSGIWLSRDAVESDSEIQRQLGDYAAKQYPALVAGYPEKVKAWETSVAQAKATGVKEPVKPSPPTPPGGFAINHFFSEGRFENYGVNYPIRIANVIPYAVRGIVWDQGEGGTGIAGADQSAVMPALVRSWRAAWCREDLPFIYVDKPTFTTAHRDALAKLPATARAEYQGLSTINHPPDKAAYARRVFAQIERLLDHQKK